MVTRMKRMVCIVLALLWLPATCAQAARVEPDDAGGFVLLSEVAPEIVQEIRYYTDHNFMGERVDGYEEPVALLTREAADALRRANDRLMEQGYRIKVYDAYRPQQAVDHFVRWSKSKHSDGMKDEFYPELKKSELFRKGYIAEKSGHSRGSTVDITLVDMESGEELDMGGTFDYFGERSHYDYDGLTKRQRRNRRLLREVMKDCGFRPISTEWWHFRLEDEPYPKNYFRFPVSSASVMKETETQEPEDEEPIPMLPRDDAA